MRASASVDIRCRGCGTPGAIPCHEERFYSGWCLRCSERQGYRIRKATRGMVCIRVRHSLSFTLASVMPRELVGRL